MILFLSSLLFLNKNKIVFSVKAFVAVINLLSICGRELLAICQLNNDFDFMVFQQKTKKHIKQITLKAK